MQIELQRTRELGKNLVRFCLTACSAAIAILLPNFALITGLTGAFGNNLLAFVFVPVFYMRRRQQLEGSSGSLSVHPCKQHSDTILCCALFAFGIGLLILSTTFTLHSAFEYSAFTLHAAA